MGTAAIFQTTHWLPWGLTAESADAGGPDRAAVAARVAVLRRAGADPHYAWLAALEEAGAGADDHGHWAGDEKAVG